MSSSNIFAGKAQTKDCIYSKSLCRQFPKGHVFILQMSFLNMAVVTLIAQMKKKTLAMHLQNIVYLAKINGTTGFSLPGKNKRNNAIQQVLFLF